ncbi:MFS general substrate transporter [Plenodomus tracheiphilus IPT5]|uniref:MFS general substrate transporter n=1 Tax=Plenodomus tracheiphilus IPT5 TaxID=1408161 RepID=A0A6A7AZB3_9PLEO|nr:MFS general substrate transporter [Plenodomus tracheiphilus IPT5]
MARLRGTFPIWRGAEEIAFRHQSLMIGFQANYQHASPDLIHAYHCEALPRWYKIKLVSRASTAVHLFSSPRPGQTVAMATALEKDHDFSSEEKTPVYANAAHDQLLLAGDYEGKPTEEELRTLRRVPGSMPTVAYVICAVEFAERASYYGVQQLIGNYVNRPLPKGGNGWGAPPKGTQETAGALGLGTVKANAVSQSFSMLVYCLPIVFGWLADTRTGRFKLICYGILVFGIAHALMVVSAAKPLLADGSAKVPYLLSLYILAVGAAMFKPNVSPLLLDQMATRVPKVITTKKGERVIEDPEATTERVMLWFYLLINIGGFMGVATTYSEKYVGWWLAFLLPLLLYLPLPFLMWYLKKRLILHPPAGSELGRVFRLLAVVFRRGGIKRIGRGGFWNLGKPSHIAAAGLNISCDWNDQFVEDVRRAFQATGIFCFFPIQYLNDNGIGGAAGYLSTMLTTNGVPNDVIQNFNTLSIIVAAPIFNYVVYPAIRKARIHYGPVARITTGLALSSIGGAAYAVLNYYAYQQSPCGEYGSDNCEVGTGVAPITIWWMAIPYGLGGVSEIFVNVPAYGIAYSRAPVNMRGLVSAINLFNTGVAYAIGLACSSVIRDPYLTWDFGGPAIVGGVLCVVFWFMFKHIDKEEYTMRDESTTDYHLELEGTPNVLRANSINATTNDTHEIGKNEEMMISQKQ